MPEKPSSSKGSPDCLQVTFKQEGQRHVLLLRIQHFAAMKGCLRLQEASGLRKMQSEVWVEGAGVGRHCNLATLQSTYYGIQHSGFQTN